ncbi:uncharacterized protein BDZ83DRAFT_647004 [Colletotrichum acutatum]|uniref:Uncharacterized protein n=1 Tax=Glomerella acutata TaxID=27357 RepID=A0AAD9D1S8_GLOAC|nr:uncharacterized protein BDZ83DRAFT_647004 [Colletotrichum acutatum]KAK1730224.1 hypothetical protein BDZ83DRAFT_647004 [Colletotrichum acutatum]
MLAAGCLPCCPTLLWYRLPSASIPEASSSAMQSCSVIHNSPGNWWGLDSEETVMFLGSASWNPPPYLRLCQPAVKPPDFDLRTDREFPQVIDISVTRNWKLSEWIKSCVTFALP